jgi:ferritin-like protein
VFSGARVIADKHFSDGLKLFKNKGIFHTSFAVKKDDVPNACDDEECVINDFVAAKQSAVTGITKATARVDHPCGSVKNSLQSLAEDYLESEIQQDNTVLATLGLYKWSKQRRLV